jgi:arginyl-tRNA synthetase
MNIEQTLQSATAAIFKELFGAEVAESTLTINLTKKEFEGDYTVVTFPLIKLSKKSPEETGTMIGNAMLAKLDIVSKFNVVKGFLNISFTDKFWAENLKVFSAWPASEIFG